jgi:hypothetical protein
MAYLWVCKGCGIALAPQQRRKDRSGARAKFPHPLVKLVDEKALVVRKSWRNVNPDRLA